VTATGSSGARSWRPRPVREPATGERCRVPDAVLGLVCDEVVAAVGAPDSVLELWSERGQMLPRAVTALQSRRAQALFSSPDAVPAALFSVVGLRIGAMEDEPEPAQVVLGVPPWRWAPSPVTLSTRNGPVQLCDDPAHVTLLRACVAMPQDGVAAAVVGLGFLARRGGATVAANFGRFGIRITRVLPLERGLFRPASGPGRVLLVLRRQPPDGVPA
jgi:hypothetical protein